MATRSILVLIVACFYTSIIQTKIPKAVATKFPIDEYMIEDQRTHRKQNYVVQRALNSEMLNKIDNIGPSYAIEPFVGPDKERSTPEELPSLIVDYANMIRNDIILLDNSVEARTRKRGNIKRYNGYNNEAITDTPCNCASQFDTQLTKSPPKRKHDEDLNETTKRVRLNQQAFFACDHVLHNESFVKEKVGIIDLGRDSFPHRLESIICNETACEPPYRCKANYYHIPAMIKRKKSTEESPELEADVKQRWIARDPPELPPDLRRRWIAGKVKVTSQCICARDGTD